jgi:hypothetical protein
VIDSQARPLRLLAHARIEPAKSLAGRAFPQESSDGKGTAQLPHPALAGSKRPLRGAKRTIYLPATVSHDERRRSITR